MKKIFSILSVFVLAFGWLLLAPVTTTKAAADTCTWDGSTSGDWSDGSNWSGCDNGGVPEDGDILIFPAGAANTTNSNDIAGTLTLDQVYVSGNNYAISGNPIEISGVLQFTGADNSFNMSDMTFTNASTGTSLSIDGTGNTISNAIGLNMTGGHDFNLYANEDFTAPHFTGGSIGNFNKQGSANLTTSTNASTFTASGAINISAGLFICNNANCGGVSANNMQTISGGALVLDGANITEIHHDINLSSSASPQLNMLPGTVTVNGDVSFNSTGTVYAQTGTLTLGGNILLDGSNAYLLTSSTTAATIVQDSGSVMSDSGGNRSLNIIGGRTQLNGANNYSGVTNVTNNSVLQISNNDSLGGSSAGTVVESGSALGAITSLTSAEPLQLEGSGVPTIFSTNYEGALINDSWDPNFSGDIILTGDTTIKSTDGSIDLSGAVSGTANLTIKGRTGGSANILGGTSNTYVGNTFINSIRVYLGKTSGSAINGDVEVVSSNESGHLIAGNNGGNQVPDDSTINLTNGTSDAIFEGSDSSEILGTITGNGHLESDGPGFGFTIGGGNLSGTFTGTIDNEEGTITKIGSGTWTLDGVTQPNAGTTFSFVVDGGKIVWNSTVSGAPITINTGGTLKGNGTAGTTTVNTGGTLAAGTSPGCITVSNLTLSAGSTFEEEIAGGTACTEYDRTNVNGNATLGGANLSVIPSYTPAPGTIYTILQTTNGNVIGTFNGLADGATFTANGIQFRINYTSTQVNLTVLGGTLVPTGQNRNGVVWFALAALIIGGAGMGFALKRNKLSIKRNAL